MLNAWYKSSHGLQEAGLPSEPPGTDPAAVTVQVRMPDGSRRSRRFLRSHPLQALFDFVDVQSRDTGMKPGSYKLVTQFPRRVFTDGTAGCFSDAGLDHKQEALFMEPL